MADVQLGTFAKAQVPDPAIAEALFKLGANEISQPVAGSFGTVLLRVTEIKPEVVKPLTEVAARDPQAAGGRRSDPHPARRA